MQKTISALMLVGLFLPALALARTIPVYGGTVDCETSIFSDEILVVEVPATDAQLVGCVNENGNPLLVMQPWGMNMGDSLYLRVDSGVTFSDEAGIQFSCPATTGVFGCIKLVSLDYWKSQARVIAKQTNGWGNYNYWLTH